MPRTRCESCRTLPATHMVVFESDNERWVVCSHCLPHLSVRCKTYEIGGVVV